MRRSKVFLAFGALVVVAAVSAGIIAVMHRGEEAASRPVDTAYAAPTVSAKKAGPAEVKESPAEVAIRVAATQERHVFVTFYKKGDALSGKMLAAIKSVQGKLSSRASFTSADVGNPIHQTLIKRYGVDSAPIPLTIVLAPNGAVTAGFPKEIKSTDLSDVFVSSGMASVLKILQDQKLVAVCVQGYRTKNNRKSLATAEELKAAPELGGAVEIVKIDPSDRSESKFMKMCQVDTQSADSQLLVLAPPGKLVGKFDGTVTKDTVMARLASALGGGGCGGGSCGPSACGP